jgi:hypothetical protein
MVAFNYLAPRRDKRLAAAGEVELYQRHKNDQSI